MRRFPSSRSRGLTLIELIIGMGIITVIFLALGYIFHQAVTCHNVAVGQAEIYQQARVIFDYLGRELSGIPRDGRLVVASPGGAANLWGVTVYGDVLCFTTATPLPVRKSDQPSDELTYHNLAAVCYYRWLPSPQIGPVQQALYRITDRMDTGQTLADLGTGRITPPRSNPDVRDQLAVRVITPLATGPPDRGAFEVEVYDSTQGKFLPVEGNEVFDSATKGLPRAIRVSIRLWDRHRHVVDETTGERGLEFKEVFEIPAGQ